MKLIKIAQFLLAFLCLALLFSYFYKIGSVPLVRLDDGELMQISETFALHGNLGSQMMDTGHHENLYYHVHPPLYYLVNGFVFKLTGIGILQSRLVSLFSAILIIILTFLVSGIMLKLPFSINNFLSLTALFLSTPMFFVLSRSNRPEMLTLVFVLLAILSYVRFIEIRESWPLFISGLCCGLAMTTQVYAVFMLIFLLISQLFDRQRNWLRILLFLSAFVIPLSFYLIWIFNDFPSFFYQTIIMRQAADKLNLVSIIDRYRYFFSSFETVATTLFFILSIFILFYLKPGRENRFTEIFSSPPLFIKLCFLTVFIFIPVINKYYYVILLPFIYLFFSFRLLLILY